MRPAGRGYKPAVRRSTILAAGLDGIAGKKDPGKRLDINMYNEGHTVKGAKKLPLNLLDALRAFTADGLFKNAFGTEFVEAYVKLKTQSWNEYMGRLTKWELETTLDC